MAYPYSAPLEPFTSLPSALLRRRPVRVMIYSHDTFGLGHLRRSRAIANALVNGCPDASVLIVSGSPVTGHFNYGRGVDFIRIPGVTKMKDGEYRSLSLTVSLDEVVALRQAIIRQAAETFRPEVVIVDKEPTGFHGELLPALDNLKQQGASLVLGLRDVLDEPAYLVPEWQRKGAVEALAHYYDRIWVFGLKEIYQPLACLNLPPEIEARTTYTGYLKREVPKEAAQSRYPKMVRDPFILVTTGGGGDGEDMIDWVISAYEAVPTLKLPALIVFGPFVKRARRHDFLERIARHPKLDALLFDSKLELLMHKAEAVVAMGGYNTFCEILSFNKRALIVPRTQPRLEQHIRAVEAERLGLTRTLSDDKTGRDPLRMAAMLHTLPQQPQPSQTTIPGLLGGLDSIAAGFPELVALAHARLLQAAE